MTPDERVVLRRPESREEYEEMKAEAERVNEDIGRRLGLRPVEVGFPPWEAFENPRLFVAHGSVPVLLPRGSHSEEDP